VTGSYEHGNNCSCFIKSGEYLDHLSDYQLSKKDHTPQFDCRLQRNTLLREYLTVIQLAVVSDTR
jgi:hypothetical protein